MEEDERERANGRFFGGQEDRRASSCYFKGTPEKFIGSMRGKFGEITISTTLAESQSKMISRWD